MAKALFALGRWSHRHHWAVILCWALLLAALGGAAAGLQKGFSDEFEIPGAPSAEAAELLSEAFPGEPNPVAEQSVTLVFAAPEGERLADPANSAAVDRVLEHIRDRAGQIGDDAQLVNPVELNPTLREAVVAGGVEGGLPREVAERDGYFLRVLSDDGRVGTAMFSFDVAAPPEIEPGNRQAVLDAMDLGREAGIEVEAMGPGFFDPVEITAVSEVVGIGVAFLVLALTFGSLVAAGLPLVTAVTGVAVGALGIVLMTAFWKLNTVTPVLAVMIGLAVGIDYALFIMARYRAELRGGLRRADAAGLAVATAGSSVVFAGLTVLIALAALTLAGIPFLSLMGVSAAATVAVAVLLSLTLVPALLAVAGRRAFAGAIPGVAGNPVRGHRVRLFGDRTLGRRWVGLVHRVPGLMLVAVIGILGALAVPAKDLALALPSDATAEYGSTQRRAVQLVDEGFGPGRNAQMIVVVDARDADPAAPALAPLAGAVEDGRAAAVPYVLDHLRNNVDVDHVQIIGANEAGTAAQLLLTPVAGPLDDATGELIAALRRQQPQLAAATGARIGITGLVPIEHDVTVTLTEAMPVYLAVVVGLAVVLLLLVFRSIAVPLTAGAGFLLSVGAAFGLTVLFWQEGLWDLVPTPGPLISFMPIFLIGVTFGLAMDYQVFLVSRMREHFTKSGGRARPGSPHTAVEESIVEGFSLGARVVTAAAIIMISVFVAFIGQPLAFVRIFGFALGAAILFDAFLIRMTFIPAALFLLGRATWWLPGWLDRVLPKVDVEGEGIEGHRRRLLERAAVE